jgi:large subunit ribosomal protein L15
MKLNELNDNKGARKSAMRVGRGIGSGKGKTAGSGHKGQKARSGVAINGYEGGQMPIYMRLPKRGFNSLNKKDYQVVNVGRLQKAVDAGALDAKKAITVETLVEAGVVGKVVDGVRLLAKGELKAKLDITVTGASKAAVEAVEKAGGKVTLAS